MRYLLKEKFFSLADSFTIRNEAGEEVYQAVGRLLGLGDRLSFQDMKGNELATIYEKLVSLHATYHIHRGKRHVATVSKDLFSLLHHRFQIDVPGPDDMEAEGNFMGHEYRFTRHGQEVAVVSKKWFSMTDTYGVDIRDGEDDILILASAIVIDLVADEKEE